jgi:flagellar biosynthesis protein FliQ
MKRQNQMTTALQIACDVVLVALVIGLGVGAMMRARQ